MPSCMKRSKTYVQIATTLTIAAPMVFYFSLTLAAILLVLVAASLQVALGFHNQDE